MSGTKLVSTWATCAALLYTGLAGTTAFAKSRCEADLGRVDNTFCLNDRHASGAAPLSYNWKASDQSFDLTSKVCLTSGGTVGARKDLVLALDRSQATKEADDGRRKIGADQISVVRAILDKLNAEAKADPSVAPKVSLVLFSTNPDCREFAGALDLNKEFPCTFVKAASVADDAHVANLKALLAAADGRFSQGGLAASGDYAIVSNLLAQDAVALQSTAAASLVLFGDGRTYKGVAGDTYAYLRTANYLRGQTDAKSAFAAAALAKFKMLFALAPVKSPAFGDTHVDSYDNMCAISGADPADCTAPGVKLADPASWPVNKLDHAAFAQALVATRGGAAADVVKMDTKDAIFAPLETLRHDGNHALPIDAVSYSVTGGQRVQGLVEGGRVRLENLPLGDKVAVEMQILSRGAEIKIPMTLSVAGGHDVAADLADGEMFCAASVAPATEKPKLKLSDLQGGSASCGVVADREAPDSSLIVLLVLALPLSFLRKRGKAAAAVAAMAAVTLSTTDANAEEAQGLNSMQFRPVSDGVGNADRALTLLPGQATAGLYFDYSNDAVELGGDGGDRIDSIMDDLVTMHAVAGVGLMDRVMLGIHVPYVHKTDVDRSLENEEVSGGQLGRPADAQAMLKISIARKAGFTFGLMPVATIATGEPELLIGDGSPSYGMLALFSGQKGVWAWAANGGYLQRQKPLELADDRANPVVVRGQAQIAGGVEYRRSSFYSLGGNLQWKISAGDRVDFTQSNPAEWSAFAKVKPALGLELTAGFGTGIGKGYGSPDYRAYMGASFVPDASPVITRRHVARR